MTNARGRLNAMSHPYLTPGKSTVTMPANRRLSVFFWDWLVKPFTKLHCSGAVQR